ncbi:hypothetical protein GEV41_23795 [Pseudomonas putida]|uniref:hypothetical protein n=1 Tax=Pseudomonas putida TaxID=303 RepID=UPI001570EA7A|nr:hypothetical protein [Pseudomonas putida]QKL09271.1 hypothetical protein GEV41_23795 [Pseudomonas putida]
MNSTIKWEVELAGGNPMHLHQLAGQNDASGHFWLWGGIDHYRDCKNDDFSFSSSHFDEIEDDLNVAWQIAHELVSLFNGALTLLWNSQYPQYPFRVGALLLDGRSTSHVGKRNLKGLLGALPPSAKRGRDHEDSSFVFHLLALACEYQDAYHLVKLFEQPGGWTSYYKILETIESYTTKYKLSVAVDKNIKRSFELTANNFSISGLDSRHGFKQQAKEIKTTSITIEEGYKFISGYARRYLSARFGSTLRLRPIQR